MTASPLEGATFVFDLDGTLVESGPDIVRAMNHVLESEGVPTLTMDEVRPLIGHGAVALITRGFKTAGHPLPEDRIDEMRQLFLDYYAANIADHSHAFPHVEDTLVRLKAQGAILAVATNKPQVLADGLIGALGLTPFFGSVIGADTAPSKKPHADHVFMAIERAGGRADRAVFIGDSRTDERAARNAGLPFILYPFGYREADEDLQPDALLEDYRTLPDLAASLLSLRTI